MIAPRSFAVLLTFLVATPALAQRVDRFQPDDWITLRDFRFVTSVAASNQGAYFGTTSGVLRFDTLRDAWRSPITASDGLPDGHVTSIVAEPASGDVWIGTRRGVVRYLEFAGVIERVSGPPASRVEELRIDLDTGDVFAFVAASWWRAAGGAPAMDRSDPPPRTARGSIDVREVDPTDLPWIDPLFVRGTVDPTNLVRLTEFVRDQRGDYYVGTWGDNGRRWGAARRDWEPLGYGLAGQGGGPIIDSALGMWFAPLGQARFTGTRGQDAPLALALSTARAGWSYVEPRTTPGLPTATPHTGVAIGDTLFLGSDFGLTRFDGRDWHTWGWNADTPLDAVYALAVDGERLWIGTARGLVAWDRGNETSQRQYLSGRAVTALAVAPDAVFVGTTAGLYAGSRDPLDRSALPDELVRTEAPGSRVRALALRDTTLVVATGSGVGVFNRRDGAWRFVSPLAGPLDGVPLSLAIDRRQIWIGTDRALVRWELATGETNRYDVQDGLAGAPVYHLLALEDAIWASTPAGVSRFAWRRAVR